MLNEASISFASFDILSDEEVRQGLKQYSSWPTYPQLYVHGSLIGGVDIVAEMKALDTTRDQWYEEFFERLKKYGEEARKALGDNGKPGKENRPPGSL